MKRREFLKGLGVLAVAPFLPFGKIFDIERDVPPVKREAYRELVGPYRFVRAVRTELPPTKWRKINAGISVESSRTKLQGANSPDGPWFDI
jgi:hypothetical protein